MLQRRDLLKLAPLAGFALSASAVQRLEAQGESPDSSASDDSRRDGSLLASPPVVQHRSESGFSVAFAVSGLATGWVEWDTLAEDQRERPDQLRHKAIASHHGLVGADDRVLSVQVDLADVPPGTGIFYRVVAQPLAYANAYSLERGEPQAGPIRRLKPWNPNAEAVTIAVVNDTHENAETLARLAERIEAIDPDLLVWNGDTCNDFDDGDNLEAILLGPGAGPDGHDGGWAATRPLLFVNGNHDIRGRHARRLPTCLLPIPGAALPYSHALRLGPLTLVGLDTGEDKPDHHPAFAGTAAYQPYKQLQGRWLNEAILTEPRFTQAPWRLALCHIPLRGREGDNDGRRLDGSASYSGDGAEWWLPQLAEAGFHAVISGHTHRWRVDEAADGRPMQIVGGGPQPQSAALILVQARADRLDLRVEDLGGQALFERTLEA